jgi:hypothetical protein
MRNVPYFLFAAFMLVLGFLVSMPEPAEGQCGIFGRIAARRAARVEARYGAAAGCSGASYAYSQAAPRVEVRYVPYKVEVPAACNCPQIPASVPTTQYPSAAFDSVPDNYVSAEVSIPVNPGW